MSLSSFYKNEKLTQGRSLWNPLLKNSQPRPKECAPQPCGDLLPGAGPPCTVGTTASVPGPQCGARLQRLPVAGALVGGSGRWLPALGTGQCLAVGPTQYPEATKYSIEHASRQGPGTQKTRTTLGHCLLGSQGARRPAAEMELPLSDYGVQPARGPGTDP